VHCSKALLRTNTQQWSQPRDIVLTIFVQNGGVVDTNGSIQLENALICCWIIRCQESVVIWLTRHTSQDRPPEADESLLVPVLQQERLTDPRRAGEGTGNGFGHSSEGRNRRGVWVYGPLRWLTWAAGCHGPQSATVYKKSTVEKDLSSP